MLLELVTGAVLSHLLFAPADGRPEPDPDYAERLVSLVLSSVTSERV